MSVLTTVAILVLSAIPDTEAAQTFRRDPEQPFRVGFFNSPGTLGGSPVPRIILGIGKKTRDSFATASSTQGNASDLQFLSRDPVFLTYYNLGVPLEVYWDPGALGELQYRPLPNSSSLGFTERDVQRGGGLMRNYRTDLGATETLTQAQLGQGPEGILPHFSPTFGAPDPRVGGTTMGPGGNRMFTYSRASPAEMLAQYPQLLPEVLNANQIALLRQMYPRGIPNSILAQHPELRAGQPSPTPSNEVTLWCARLEGDEEKGKRYADNRVRNTIVELENTEDDGKTDYPANYQKELITKFNAHRSKFSPTKGFEPLNGSDFSAGDAVTELVRRRIVAEDRNNPEVSSGKRKQITPDKVKFTNLKGGAEDPRCEGRTGPITSDQLLPRAPAGPGTAGAGTLSESGRQQQPQGPAQFPPFDPQQAALAAQQAALQQQQAAQAAAQQAAQQAQQQNTLGELLRNLGQGGKQGGGQQGGSQNGSQPASAPQPGTSGLPTGDPSAAQCPQDFKSVCGVDGNTYPNRCVAETYGVPVQHTERCSDTITSGSAPPDSTLGAFFQQLSGLGFPQSLIEQVVKTVVEIFVSFFTKQGTLGTPAST